MSKSVTEQRLKAELDEAEAKAFDSLARYKFAMFGYWAGIWVHLNRITGANRPNPFRPLVHLARRVQQQDGHLPLFMNDRNDLEEQGEPAP